MESSLKERFSKRELMLAMWGLLRKQINKCAEMVDAIETCHWRNALDFLGVPEAIKEGCSKTLLNTLNQKMSLKDVTATSRKYAIPYRTVLVLHLRNVVVQCWLGLLQHRLELLLGRRIQS